eukprot:CAMPEP_0172425756 /NCGR_PEP_ID=MMETSP1064-20121228/33862_1 /TAXON_ID=202472 /ORGANISM="Aulacoseira subarctica , Strain CCAP 1002/5" /LENGTH=213 /DNA_ID=CAMNT_0013168915 /DNA_START=87 /DNA_END=728 /DNA_ORIENTATION=-
MAAASGSSIARRVGKLSVENTAFFLCDIQDKFIPLILCSTTVVQTARLLTSASKELKIPLVVTEQYRKVFGATSVQCFADPDHYSSLASSIVDKKKFSMMTPEVTAHVDSLNAQSIVLFGIEAHVCLQQTCLDLLESGRDVHVIADACSSMKLFDREIALQRMQNAGAYLTTAQSAIFMLMESADHPNFKKISALVKEHALLPNEFDDLLRKK